MSISGSRVTSWKRSLGVAGSTCTIPERSLGVPVTSELSYTLRRRWTGFVLGGAPGSCGAFRGVVFRGVREEGVGEEEVLDRVVKEAGWGSRMAEMAIAQGGG
jgi:hypothetical protein